MPGTRISVGCPDQDDAPARIDLITGMLAPRLISRTDRTARVGITAAQMLLLEGDQVELDIDVGEGCSLELHDIGGTVAYPPRERPADQPGDQPGDVELSRWSTSIRLGEGATLSWRGLPLVVSQGAVTLRRTTAHLGEGARLLMRETVVLGRHGETGGRVTTALSVSDAHGPVLLEETALDGLAPRPGILGRRRVLDSVVCAGFSPETAAGDLVFDRPGAMARMIGDDAHRTALDERMRQWEAKMHLRG